MTSNSDTEVDIENMSDEEFLNLDSPPKMKPAQEEDDSLGSQEGDEDVSQGDDDNNGSDDSNSDDASGDNSGNKSAVADEPAKQEQKTNPLSSADDDDKAKPDEPKKAATEKAKVEEPAKGTENKETKPAGDGTAVKAETKSEPVNYEALYKEIMKPFKANGKEISMSNPEEVRQLMQMGANYTKKMQGLQPALRVVKMLENNGLMDEGKLSYLIDLSKKDPEAIRKLVKDSGIDPMDMDTSKESDYKPKNYSVSDQQMAFDSVLQDVSMSEIGQKTVVMIDREWDKASKQALWKDPEILRVITNHKQDGLYDQIADEVNRQKTLGYLTNVPFIAAYKQVGDIMKANGFLKLPNQPTAPVQQQTPVQQQPQRQVLETRTAPRRPAAAPDNGDKARAASPVRTAPKAPPPDYNPLSMSDEEFEKTASLAKRL